MLTIERIREVAYSTLHDRHKPRFYACGCCGHLHPVALPAPCSDESTRFERHELDTTFGCMGWVEDFCELED